MQNLLQSQLDSIKESLENGADESVIIEREVEEYLETHCEKETQSIEFRGGETYYARNWSEKNYQEALDLVTEEVEKIKKELGL